MKKKNLWIAGGALAAVICLFLAVFIIFKPFAGAGVKSVTVEVTGEDGQTKAYQTETKAKTLRELMDQLNDDETIDFSYEGHMAGYGMFIDTINGETPLIANQCYWAIYVNSEYGLYGADTQVVEDGDVFGLIWESYAEE